MFGTRLQDIQHSTCTHLNFKMCGGLEESIVCSDCSIKTRINTFDCAHQNTEQDQEGVTICVDCKLVICNHLNVVEDFQEGTTVCTDCAFVVKKQLYLPQTFTHRKNVFENSKKENDANDFLKNVCENVQISNNICVYAINQMKKVNIHTRNQNFKTNELASYSLYDALNHFDTPRTPEEMSRFTGTTPKTIWKIEKQMRNPYVIGSDATLYVDRLCANMSELTFRDKQSIKEKIRNSRDFTDVRPTCLVATITHLHCKDQKYNITLKNICEICNVSSSNVHKLIRKSTAGCALK